MISQEAITKLRASYKAYLESELGKVDVFTPALKALEGKRKGIVLPIAVEAVHDPETGVVSETLREVARASVQTPEGFVSG